ncbi:hypothetical protein [Pseudomonas sp. v388]|uniref:hypothetical protein n=1 Tax=Pseudomonas sp. v388 TaxID=2479849 RepID=UPI002113E5E6|nr:hypothetical protein [Pseudomonas sp. v388]
MKPTLLSVALASMLCTACSTTLEETAVQHDGARSSALPSSTSAPAIQPDELADTADSNQAAKNRSSHQSMHPKTALTSESSDEAYNEPLRATGD